MSIKHQSGHFTLVPLISVALFGDMHQSFFNAGERLIAKPAPFVDQLPTENQVALLYKVFHVFSEFTSSFKNRQTSTALKLWPVVVKPANSLMTEDNILAVVFFQILEFFGNFPLPAVAGPAVDLFFG